MNSLAPVFLGLVVLVSACGGQVEDDLSSGAGGNSAASGGASPGVGGGSGAGSGSGDTCIRDAGSPCESPADCCSGSPCVVYDISTKSKPYGICAGWGLPTGAKCEWDSGGICQSGDCNPNNKECARSHEYGPCMANNDCDTGYCYVERSVCLGMDCDPTQVADADPEACLRVGIPCVKKNETGQCIEF